MAVTVCSLCTPDLLVPMACSIANSSWSSRRLCFTLLVQASTPPLPATPPLVLLQAEASHASVLGLQQHGAPDKAPSAQAAAAATAAAAGAMGSKPSMLAGQPAGDKQDPAGPLHGTSSVEPVQAQLDDQVSFGSFVVAVPAPLTVGQ